MKRPGQYPDDLAAALAQLGDYAGTHDLPTLAAHAYARILTLAEPFPARTSDPVRAIEGRLEALCREADIALAEVQARASQPIGRSAKTPA